VARSLEEKNLKLIESTPVAENEFGERSFVISGPDGSTWQVIEREGSQHPPVTEFMLQALNN
jgi:hypothetical protein